METRLKTGKTIKGKGFDLEFLFSSKNLDIVEKYILPQIAIQSKKNKVQYFIDSRMASVA